MAGLFVVTVLALVAVPFGDPRAPLARLLERFGGWAIGSELLAFLIVGVLALAVDRRQTLQNRPLMSQSPPPRLLADTSQASPSQVESAENTVG